MALYGGRFRAALLALGMLIGAPAAGCSAQPGTVTAAGAAAPMFPAAEWLNTPIARNPKIAPNSATWVGYFAESGAQRVANLHDYATTLVHSSAITGSTPRYDVTFTKAWGPDPFGGHTVPIPAGTLCPPGDDGALAIHDPVTGQVFGLWQARYDKAADRWTASWGGMVPAGGSGVDRSGSATGTNISRFAGVVTAAQFTAAREANAGLDHALVFSSDISGPGFVGPATKSDGVNAARVAVPIPEGYRVQLDPAVNVDALPAITAGEKVIAKTLQTHGAYVIDTGGARMAFSFEALPGATSSSPGRAYTAAGFDWDYFDMTAIPWSKLRVLAP